jgi:hypothetical protein
MYCAAGRLPTVSSQLWRLSECDPAECKSGHDLTRMPGPPVGSRATQIGANELSRPSTTHADSGQPLPPNAGWKSRRGRRLVSDPSPPSVAVTGSAHNGRGKWHLRRSITGGESVMTQRLTDERTGETTHRIRGNRLTDERTGETTHRIRGNRLTDERTGETTHRIRGNRLTDERTGETTHRIRG